MASENKGVCDIVKNCKILLLDIEGTTTSISFVKDKLFPYAEENVKQFLDSQWDEADVKAVVTALRNLAIEDKEGKVEGVVDIPNEDASKEEQIEGLVNSVKWQMSADRKVGPLKTLQGLIWKQGYDKGDIKGHVFDDVSTALQQWHSAEDKKVYIYSSGSVQAQKLLFGQSLAGDLLKYIDGHFDTAVGAKQEAVSYKTIAEKIGCKPEEIVFLTDILKEAEAAREAGLKTALVSREGNAPLPANELPVIHSLSELSVSNKRKPDTQEDETPAKIPKTDSEEKDKKAESITAPETSVQETMEVEDKVTVEAKKVEVVVEEVTDSNESASVVEDIEPVVIEEKNTDEDAEMEPVIIEEKKTDEDAEMTPVNPVDVETKEPEAMPDAEQVPDVVIEDVTDKIDEVEEMITDHIKAIVEEPAISDLDELANVGEVLEKECDEILSKVSNVTNLDNISVKPMLNTIAEENVLLEENGDTNDIVDNILDSELEMEERADTEIDPSTVSEMSDEKTEEALIGGTVETEASPDVNDVPKTAEFETKIEKKEEIDATEPKKTGELETNIETKTTEEIKSTEPKETAESKPNVETNTTEEIKATENNKETVAKSETPKEVVQEKIETEVTDADKIEVNNVTENNVTEEKKEVVTEPEEPKVNGKAVNGDAEVKANGETKEDTKPNGDDVSSRLAVTNGKVNGDVANGDSAEVEQGQGDCKVPDIKVKTVVAEEPLPDPVEQPSTA